MQLSDNPVICGMKKSPCRLWHDDFSRISTVFLGCCFDRLLLSALKLFFQAVDNVQHRLLLAFGQIVQIEG